MLQIDERDEMNEMNRLLMHVDSMKHLEAIRCRRQLPLRPGTPGRDWSWLVGSVWSFQHLPGI